MVRLNEKGVSDIIVVAFMFILLVLASVLVHQYQTRALESAAHRQNGLKSTHLYKSLEKSEVNPYGVSALNAAAEQLVLKDPTVPENHLREWLENTTNFLLPDDLGAELTLTRGENKWSFTHLPKGKDSSSKGEQFIQEGALAITRTGGDIVIVEIKVNMFRMV